MEEPTYLDTEPKAARCFRGSDTALATESGRICSHIVAPRCSSGNDMAAYVRGRLFIPPEGTGGNELLSNRPLGKVMAAKATGKWPP